VKDSEVLALAAEVIENGFAKDGYALNKDDQRVAVMSAEAVSWCMVGACARVTGGEIHDADAIVSKWVAPLMPQRTVGGYGQGEGRFRQFKIFPKDWNDEAVRTKEEVAGKLREAAVKAKEKSE
jgi:hypothetical protein